MSTKYTVSFHNRSTDDGKFCIFQKPVESNPSDVMPLAWLVQQVNDGTDVDIEWSLDYSFVWSKSGELKPGVTFKASEIRDTDPMNESLNTVRFTKPNDSYKFHDPMTSDVSKLGQLTVYTGAEIPKKDASIGIGMSGESVFAVNAQPNMAMSFSVHPEYWIVFGDYQLGQVIDFKMMTQAKKIVFASNQSNLDITLDASNSWKVV